MWEKFRIFNFLKILIVSFPVVFLVSCKPKTTEISSGTAPSQQVILSENCSQGSTISGNFGATGGIVPYRGSAIYGGSVSSPGGSVTVVRKIPSAVNPHTLGSLSLNQLRPGEKVSISGTVTHSSCYNGPASFTCEATVRIDTNRGFVCDTATISGTTIGPQVGVSQPPLVPSYPHYGTHSAAKTFVGGSVGVFGNGTKIYVDIQFAPPYPSCTVRFACPI